MGDPFIEALKMKEKTLSELSDDKVMYLALSEVLMEMAAGKDVPPGTKASRIVLSVELAKRAGVKW